MGAGLAGSGDLDTVVVGAGLAGLAAGTLAARAGMRVVVLDARSAGGRARSDERSGFLLNQGPRALYLGGEALSTLGRLGVDPSGGRPAVKGSTGLNGGCLELLPSSPASMVRTRLLSTGSKVRLSKFLVGLRHLRTQALASASTADWLESLALPEDALRLTRAIIRVATYSDDQETLSADAAARQLQLAFRSGVRYIDGGWQSLVDRLAVAARASGTEILESRPARQVYYDGRRWVVTTDGGDLPALTVLLACGGPESARRLLPADPGWETGPDATAACLDLGLRRPPDRRIIFGIDTPLYLSTHCPPARLAPPENSVVHVLRYGARSSELDRPELQELASRAGISDADIVVERFLRRMVVSHGLPRPGAGLSGRPSVEVPGSPGAFVAGDWVGPTGMLSDASLASARAAVRAIADHVGARRNTRAA